MNPHINRAVGEAYDLAKCLRDDPKLNALQRMALARIVEGFEAAKTGLMHTPWFERHGKLTPEEAADMEVGFYGKGKSVE